MAIFDNVFLSRFKTIFLAIIAVWIIITFLDINSADFKYSSPLPSEKSLSFYKDRQLLLSRLINPQQLVSSLESISFINSSVDELSAVSPSKLQNDDSEDTKYKSWLKKQDKLKQNIKKVCNKYGSSLRKSVPSAEFMFDSEHNLLFCRNAKVGTTTWLTHFLLLSSTYRHLYEDGNITSKQLHREVPKLFKLPTLSQTEMKDLFETSNSFSIVRHPFERLVSAFQDKLVDQGDKFYKRVVDHIRIKYGEITFTSFVYMILDNSDKLCKEMNSCRLDKHWKPFISRCGYCDMPYKVIAKAENFADDQKFIGRLANVTFQKIESHKSSGGDTKSLAKKYFSDLDLDTVKDLYEIYKVDFEMFGYSPDIYFDLAAGN